MSAPIPARDRTPLDATEIERLTRNPGVPYRHVEGAIPGVDTLTHWANGNVRLLTPEAYARGRMTRDPDC